MCHTVNEDRDWQCRRCGYEFGQPIERVRELLRDQMTNARIALWFLIAADVVLFAIPLYCIFIGARVVILPGMLVVAFLTRATVKNAQKISISKQSLRSLAEQDPEKKPDKPDLPQATLRSG